MARHLLAWSESVDNINDEEINVIEDSVITMPNNKRFTVPIGLNTIDWLYAGGNNLRSARLFAPSLEKRRKIARIIPHNGALRPPQTYNVISTVYSGVELDETEDISVRVTYPDVTTPERVVALLSLKGGREETVPSGEVMIVRATGNATLTSFKWSLVTITPEVQLEAGNYALINFIPYSATCIAARVIIQGQPYRGGVLGVGGTTEDVALRMATERFNLHADYNYGVFTHKAIPQFEFLSTSSDTSEVVYLKIVKIG